MESDLEICVKNLRSYIEDIKKDIDGIKDQLSSVEEMLDSGADIEHIDRDTFENYMEYKDYVASGEFRDAVRQAKTIERQKETIHELRQENFKLMSTIIRLANKRPQQDGGKTEPILKEEQE